MVRLISLLALGAACGLAASTANAQTSRASQPAAAPAGDAQRLICRRVQETGSLVRTLRQCFTRAEWDRIAEIARRGAQSTISGLAETSVSN